MSVEVVVRVETVAVTVDVTNGERLRYQITTRGAAPIFSLEDAGVEQILLTQDDEPASTVPLTHQRRWPRRGDEIVTLSDHVLSLSFLAAVQYTYKVDLLARGGAVKDAVIDMDFIATSAEDRHFQNLTVNLE